jgi:hypothetical protein
MEETLNEPDVLHVTAIVNAYGMEAGLRHHGDFEEVKDEKFHRLLESYRAAATRLEQYIGWEEK